MLDSLITRELTLGQAANVMAGHPLWPLLCAILALVGLFLALTWFRLQPQAFFLHFIVFFAGLLLWVSLPLWPAGLLQLLQQSGAAVATPILAPALLLLWLAMAPFGFARPDANLTIRDILRQRRWLAVATGAVLLLALLFDGFRDSLLAAIGQSTATLPSGLPAAVWAVLAGGLLITAVFSALRGFKAAPGEGALFLTGFLIAAIAGYLHLATGRPAALASLTATAGLLVLLLLLYQRRFASLEANLRTSLYDENLTLREENIIQGKILALTREAVLQLDREETVSYANSAFTELTGYELRKLRGKRLQEVVSKSFYEAAVPALKAARSSREESFEILLHRQQRADVALHVLARPLLDSRGKFSGFHLGFLDITEQFKSRANMQARIQQQERDLNLYKAALDKSKEAVVVTDAECRILFVSTSFTRITGHGRVDLLSRSTSVYRLDTREEETALQSLRQGKPWSGSFANRRKDGSQFQVDVAAVPIMADTGELQYVVWTERDAAQRKKVEQALEHARQKMQAQKQQFEAFEEEYRQVFSTLETGVILVRPDGACRHLNPAATRMLGFAPDTISLHNLPAFVRDLLRMGASYGSKIRSEAVDFIDEFQRPDGQKRQLRWRATPIASQDKNQLGVVLQIFDLTSASALESQVQQLEKELATVRKERSSSDTTSVFRLQKLLDVAEAVHSEMGFKAAMEMAVEVAAALGWRNLLLYEKQDEAGRYASVAAGGFPVRVQRALAQLGARQVDQYCQSRFALGNAFFLRSDDKKRGATWEFVSDGVKLPAHGKWQNGDLLLLPLTAKGKQVGLFLCGPRADGELPTAESVQELERLATQVAFALEQKKSRYETRQKAMQDKLLLDMSKVEHLEASPEKEIEQIIAQAQPVLQGEVCLIALGPPPFGACTGLRSGSRKKVVPLPDAKVERIIAQVRAKVPASGAAAIEIEARNSALGEALGLTGGRETRATIVAAPLQWRRKLRGFICCTPADKQVDEATLSFLAEFAHRAALILENAQLFVQIQAKAQEMEQANTYISEFLANVSHELRTPLHTILSYVELLRQQEGASPESRLRHLRTIQTSGNKLLSLINDLLDLSKIEAGKLEPEISTFDPRGLVQEIADEISHLSNKSGLTLKVQVDKGLPPLLTSDRNILSRVLLNLARNAQKFTPEGGTVEIDASLLEKDRLRLRVRDTGIGIAKRNLKKIFEPFGQIDRKASRRYEGTGLGLPISKKLVELLGGSIAVESSSGQGTTVTVEVPVQAIWRRPRGKSAAPAPAAASSSRKKVPRRGYQVLMVDDDESTREAMQFLLENAGYKVEFAGDGPTALTLAQHLRPDVILLDIMMPGMDGYQVARMLKAQKQLKHIPVIALTARAMAEDREKAREAGCDDFLTKPFAIDDFYQVVRRHTAGETVA